MTKFIPHVAAAALLATTFVAGAANATAINIAPIYGTASASSQDYGAPSLAIDNNLDTTYAGGSIFESGSQVHPNWVVDLGQNFSLSSLVIYQRTDEPPTKLNNFSVTVFDSLGNITFNQANIAPNPGDTVSTPFTINFASVIQGKAVQIVLDSASPSYLALAEVQVYSDVPEPASLALLAVGLVGVAGARRRFGAARTA